MSAINKDWLNEFGVVPSALKAFFASKADLNSSTANASQSHILRRAFDLLKLDGVLCTDNAPLVYFKTVRRIDTAEVERLHQIFWNHGGAPVLVLVAPQDVHIYSGLVRPQPVTPQRRSRHSCSRSKARPRLPRAS